MRRYTVVFGDEALDDLEALYGWIRSHAGAKVATDYTDRLKRYCARLSDFPERGTRRHDLHAQLRLMGFERRVSIAFIVRESDVVIVRLFYGGRQIDADDFRLP